MSITSDDNLLVYHTVAVRRASDTFRSSAYIGNAQGGEYAIAVEAYLAPEPADDLESLIPLTDGPKIAVYAYIDDEGRETRSAAITWEADPEGRFYWASDDDVDLNLISYDLDPEKGHVRAVFSGEVCYVTLPAIERDPGNCKHLSVDVDSELSRLY